MFVLIVSISSKQNVLLMKVSRKEKETDRAGVGEVGLWAVRDQWSVWVRVKEN